MLSYQRHFQFRTAGTRARWKYDGLAQLPMQTNQRMTQFLIRDGVGKQFVQMLDGTCLEIVGTQNNQLSTMDSSSVITTTRPAFQNDIMLSNTAANFTATSIDTTFPTTSINTIIQSTPAAQSQNSMIMGNTNANIASVNQLNGILHNMEQQIQQVGQPASGIYEEAVQSEEKCSLPHGTTDSSVTQILQALHDRIKKMEEVLEKVVLFMANINRLMETKKPSKTSESDKKKHDEDFSEFNALLPVQTEDKLKQMDTELKSQAYADKLCRYCESMFNLNGKREGKSFFRNLIRKFVDPSVLTPYSWLGNTRTKKGEASVSKNKSFKQDFPNFIKFVSRIMRAADFEFSTENTEESFSQFLRQKNTELKRKQSRTGAAKKSHSKKKRQSTSTKCRSKAVVPNDRDEEEQQAEVGAQRAEVEAQQAEVEAQQAEVEAQQAEVEAQYAAEAQAAVEVLLENPPRLIVVPSDGDEQQVELEESQRVNVVPCPKVEPLLEQYQYFIDGPLLNQNSDPELTTSSNSSSSSSSSPESESGESA